MQRKNAVVAACLIKGDRYVREHAQTVVGKRKAAEVSADPVPTPAGTDVPEHKKPNRYERPGGSDDAQRDPNLHPFLCKKCGQRFSSRRAKKFHSCPAASAAT